MRRSVSLLCLATLCACAGGARANRVPSATPAGAAAPERMVDVPSLVGLDLEAAAERAHAAGLELMALRVPGTPAGVVLEQNPAAGRAVPEGAPLRVRIASGTATGEVPVGPSGLGGGPGVPPAPMPELPPSVVPEAPVAATPEAPAAATPPSAGQSSDLLPIPSVLDRTEPVARRILFDAGFRVRIEPTESGVTGRVMDQLPSQGDRVPRGTEIVLKVPGYVPSPELALGSPDAAPEGTAPSTPPVIPAEPPAAPSADEPPLPIFAGAAPVAGIPPVVAPPTPAGPPAGEVPPVATPEAPPAAAPEAPPVPAPPSMPPAAPEAPLAPPADLSVPPEPPPTPPTPPATPAPEPPPAPPAPEPPPVPPSDTVPVPPSDAVPVPPSDAVPVPPPPPPSSPTESAGEPAGPSLPGLGIPKPKSPPSESRIPIAPSVSVDLTWEPVPGATGYLIELEEAVDGAWTPLQRRIVKAPKALAQIEPSNPTSADVRWRVRSVVGRRGGRPAPWVVFHLR